MTQTEREQTVQLIYQMMLIYYNQDYTITQLKRDLKFIQSSSLNNKQSDNYKIITELLNGNNS